MHSWASRKEVSLSTTSTMPTISARVELKIRLRPQSRPPVVSKFDELGTAIRASNLATGTLAVCA